MKSILRCLYVLIGFSLLQAEPVRSGKAVISSFTIPNDWVAKLLPDCDHRSLVPPLSEIHGFQISPQSAKELRKADLIVGLSPSLEPWLADWAKANDRERYVCWLNETASPAEPQHTGHQHADPHIWTDPRGVLTVLRKLHERLRKEFPEEYSEVNYHKLFTEIKSVDETLAKAFAAVPVERRRLVTQHPNLGLFACRYGLTIAGTILDSSSAEAADASARHYSRLLAKIRAENIRVIVADEGQKHDFALRLAADAGLPDPLILNFESLAPAGQPGDTWSGMMLRNGLLIRDALLRP